MDVSDIEGIKGLPWLPRAEAIEKMKLENTWTMKQVGAHLKVDFWQISRWLKPLKFCEEAKLFLNPALADNQRLGLQAVFLLARLDHDLQRYAVDGLPTFASHAEQARYLNQRVIAYEDSGRSASEMPAQTPAQAASSDAGNDIVRRRSDEEKRITDGSGCFGLAEPVSLANFHSRVRGSSSLTA